MELLDIKEFYRLILRNLRIILSTTLVGLFVATCFTIFIPKSYSASAELFVSIPLATVEINSLAIGGNFTEQRVKTYARVVNGPDTLIPVIEELGLKEEWYELAKRVKASAPLDTSLIVLTVRDEDRVRSADIANAIGKQFEKTAGKLELEDSTGKSPVKVTLAKYATTPKSPANPKPALNLLLGLILGFGLGISIGIVRQLFDDSVKNEDQLEGLVLLGAIGFDPEAIEKPLISSIDTFHTRSESFRQLRTNIEKARASDQVRAIAVTSALPGEGKTSTVLNLGIALVQANFKVICIEADMRRPTFHKFLTFTEKSSNLSAILEQNEVINIRDLKSNAILQDENSGLQILPAGRKTKNPAELFSSPNFSSLLSLLKREYDYILVDTPPVLPVTDSGLIASVCDTSLLVVKAGRTKSQQYKGAMDNLLKVKADIAGVAINMIPLDRNGQAYGYRYGYSYNYQRKYGVYGPGDYGIKSDD